MFEKIAARLAEQLDIPVEKITPDSTMQSLEIDSLDVVEMVLDLSEEMGVELEVGQKINTVGELAALLENQLG